MALCSGVLIPFNSLCPQLSVSLTWGAFLASVGSCNCELLLWSLLLWTGEEWRARGFTGLQTKGRLMARCRLSDSTYGMRDVHISLLGVSWSYCPTVTFFPWAQTRSPEFTEGLYSYCQSAYVTSYPWHSFQPYETVITYCLYAIGIQIMSKYCMGQRINVF